MPTNDRLTHALATVQQATQPGFDLSARGSLEYALPSWCIVEATPVRTFSRSASRGKP